MESNKGSKNGVRISFSYFLCLFTHNIVIYLSSSLCFRTSVMVKLIYLSTITLSPSSSFVIPKHHIRNYYSYHTQIKNMFKFSSFFSQNTHVTSHLIVFHTIKQNIITWSNIADSRDNSYIHIVYKSGTVIQNFAIRKSWEARVDA